MKLLKLLNDNLERYLMLVLLVGMTLVLGLQIVFRFVVRDPLTWSEELARFMFIWSTFLSNRLLSERRHFPEDRHRDLAVPSKDPGYHLHGR